MNMNDKVQVFYVFFYFVLYNVNLVFIRRQSAADGDKITYKYLWRYTRNWLVYYTFLQ